ncbi:MAG: glycosyltransferase, partial [Planctomycetes bacterium]|nr:glycosyltransferase [Planctomycetota bacterium]
MLISVIVPVYNAERFLNKSIESVINQSYKDIELILVNDGSTDGSETICNRYALADKRIRVISQKNSGPAAARNTGIRNAAGDFVFFLDADDFIEKNTMEILIATYNQYKPDLVMSNFSKLENNGELVRQKVTFRPGDEPFEQRVKVLSKADVVDYVRHFLRHPSNHLISYCWARLYKLSVIRENNISSNEDMHLFEDFVFNLEYLRHADKVAFVNENLYNYVMHNTCVSASMVIINGDSLLHDMKVFKSQAGEFLESRNTMNAFDVKKEIGHALVHYTIIFMVRSCRQLARDNRKRIYDEFYKIISAPILRDNLQYYSPSKG